MDTEVDTTTSEGNTEVTPDTQADTSVDTSPEVDTGSGEGVAPQSLTPTYKPDYKIKVDHQETEIQDPFLKNLIKDAETEKKVKEYAQKVMAVDNIQGRHEKVKTDFSNYQQVTQPVVQYYNHASKLLQQGDLDSFFQFLKIPDEAIFKFAISKAEESQLSPDQRYQLQQQRQTRLDKMNLEEQNQSLQSQQSQQLGEFRKQELNWVMARPDVDGIAKTYDTKKGSEAPTFRQLVINQGLAHFAATGKDLSAEEATMAVVKYLGGFVTPGNQGNTMPQNPNTQGLIPQQGAPPIIPNVTGRGTSPVKKQVRSIEDLKKKREEMISRSSG